MVREEFETFTVKLSAFYERKVRPMHGTLDLWFEKVRRIPAEALPWMENKIYEESEGWPRNLTSTMWALYHSWLQAHPEKRSFKRDQFCPDCEGGWLILEKQEDYRQPTSYSAPCGNCKQIPGRNYLTLHQALSNGFTRKDLTKHQTTCRSLPELIESVGKTMPDQGQVTWE
jgi:hypothetical protein